MYLLKCCYIKKLLQNNLMKWRKTKLQENLNSSKVDRE